MRARWLLNLVLVALVTGLALFAYFKPGAVKSSRGMPLTTLSADAVARIRIEPAGKPAIVIEKTENGWRLIAPVRARANRFNVDNLLRVLTTTSEFRAPANPAELSKVGLDKPLVKLWFNDEEIVVGAMHPLRREHYVRHRDTIHLAASYAFSTAFLDYTSLIDAQLLETGRRLVALHLPGLRLARRDGTWRREPADRKRDQEISTDRLNEFVEQWQNARALSVERLSAKPALDRIQLVLENGGKQAILALEVLAHKPEFVLGRRDEGLEYHFPEEVGRRLLNLENEKMNER